jgi:16S rRNA (guanine527-N7)-methyltransferase
MASSQTLKIGYNARCRMTPDRVAELLSPFLEDAHLSALHVGLIATYTDLLMKWNARINLTAVRDPETIVARHFGESLFAAKHLFPIPATNQSAIDVGSGAGFPGLPLKIWSPALALTLVEANQRKAVFLREVVRTLGLSGVKVFAGRAEHISEQADVVILRAVESFEQTLAIAHNLIAPKGRIAILIGMSQVKTATSTLSDIRWRDPVPLPQSHSRSLLVGQLA